MTAATDQAREHIAGLDSKAAERLASAAEAAKQKLHPMALGIIKDDGAPTMTDIRRIARAYRFGRASMSEAVVAVQTYQMALASARGASS